MWGTFLSEPLRIVALVGRCPANQLMRRMPIPDRRIFHAKDMHPRHIWGIRPSFPGLSPCPGQVAYVLLTSAPVAANSIATIALPLDLHVLSLSLAFILSQDQTLRCCIVFLFFAELNENATAIRSRARLPRPCLQGRLGYCCACISTCLLGILTWTRGFPSLSLHCQFSSLQTFQ